MKKQFKPIPSFDEEQQERAFWEKQDSSEYIDWSQAKAVRFPALKPSLRSISIRLPEDLIDQLKVIANKRDVPYQSLVKHYLAEKVREERQLSCGRGPQRGD